MRALMRIPKGICYGEWGIFLSALRALPCLVRAKQNKQLHTSRLVLAELVKMLFVTGPVHFNIECWKWQNHQNARNGRCVCAMTVLNRLIHTIFHLRHPVPCVLNSIFNSMCIDVFAR